MHDPPPHDELSAEQRTLLATFDPTLYRAGDDVGHAYACDWSGDDPHRPAVVLRPRTVADVSAMLRACHAADQPLAIQGGRTGLSGGATPRPGEWVLSTERLTGIAELDTDSKTITVGAGVTLQRIQEAADEAGLAFPLDLGARGSCVAGGLVATNAGGNQVIQRGMARALVLGLEAVLADGTVIASHNKLLKNNAGFDLKQLFIGSEGALGVVTQVTFRLFGKMAGRPAALCAAHAFDDVIALLHHVETRLGAVSAFEVMWADYYRAAVKAAGQKDPLGGDGAYYVLIETEGSEEARAREALEAALMSALEDGRIADAVVAQSGPQAATFWAIRDGVAELIPEMAPVNTFDVGVPIPAMEAFVAATRDALAAAFERCRALVFGHIADGNLHLLVSTGDAADKQAIYETVYTVVGRFGGTVTAEHGVGVNKKRWLGLCRTAQEIALMRTLKNALDPKGILNPGRVI